MPRAQANGIELEYEAWGDPAAPPVVLVMGLGMQLIAWPEALRDGLVARGFRVIAFDNRDAGLSTRVHLPREPNVALEMMRARVRLTVRAPYTLHDMAEDTVGLLESLGIARAHLVGASMGGMIAQIVAAVHPQRTASLTSIMSTTGNRRLPGPKRHARRALLSKPEAGDFESLARHSVGVFTEIGSPGFPKDPELRQRVERSIRRAWYPRGTAHQLLAILASGDRRALLGKITAPTLVIHGADDPLIPAAAARDTAKHIANAKLLEIEGMGHDFPAPVLPVIVDAVASHCTTAAT